MYDEKVFHQSDMPQWAECTPVWWMMPLYLLLPLLAALSL